ncbi:MAG: hypothetical protein KKA73_31300 [Chloroflexi bacterium]|nr:hypothetical protein [Chloroflexota bacterium]MBU1752189.1 hypothetical protein [Chloroflexota bacterium]
MNTYCRFSGKVCPYTTLCSGRTQIVHQGRANCVAPCRTAQSVMRTVAFQMPGQAAQRRRGRVWAKLAGSPARFLCSGRLGNVTWGVLLAVV